MVHVGLSETHKGSAAQQILQRFVCLVECGINTIIAGVCSSTNFGEIPVVAYTEWFDYALNDDFRLFATISRLAAEGRLCRCVQHVKPILKMLCVEGYINMGSWSA